MRGPVQDLPRGPQLHADPAGELNQDLRHTFGGTFIVNSGFSSVTTRDEAVSAVNDGTADLVAVGRPAISNSDLFTRWEGTPARTRSTSPPSTAAASAGTRTTCSCRRRALDSGTSRNSSARGPSAFEPVGTAARSPPT